MPFDHMPVLTSVKGSGPESGHIPSFLASGEIRRHRPPAPTCKGLQALSNLTPCDRGRDGPREGRRPGGSHSSFGETGVRGGDSTSGWTLTPCGLEVLVALVAVDSTATLGLSCSFLSLVISLIKAQQNREQFFYLTFKKGGGEKVIWSCKLKGALRAQESVDCLVARRV